MCCPLDQRVGEFIPTDTNIQKTDQGYQIWLKGDYNREPKSLGERNSRYFQRLELMEKIAEIADEIFHLFKDVFKKYTNEAVYETLLNLHNGAHDIEHVLHSFCLIGDLLRISSGNFFQYSENGELKTLQSLSRICHATAHVFATLKFLNQLKLCPLQRFQPAFQYASLITTMGYGLWTISLLWERSQREFNDNFKEDMRIHLGGFLFEGFNFIRDVVVLPPGVDYALSKLKAIAGIIHAWSVVQRLMPPDIEKIEILAKIPKNCLLPKRPLRSQLYAHFCSSPYACSLVENYRRSDVKESDDEI